MKESLKWWQTSVFYQIYPRSFADGNGDGIGDFKGMINKLDYLKELGIGGIWLSPHYPSPFVDCGYDIADYCGVGTEYGTLQDFKEFLHQAHGRGIRVVLDLVLNHTSDKHPWFVESRSSRENPRRDWYIWKKGKNGKPPTNWFSTFGGSAWEYDETTGEYYYHFFFREQPDLNWKNPEVKEAMFNVARFWMKMGVDGFRLDAIGTIYEDETYPDQPVKTTLEELYRRKQMIQNPIDEKNLHLDFERVFQYQHDQPGVHPLMRELRKIVDEYPDRVLIGETDDIAFYGEHNDELHLNFNFPLMRTRQMTPGHVRENQEQRLTNLPAGAWPCNTLGNHDSARMIGSFGDGCHDEAIARVNMMMLFTLKGTPFIYNGEEIGMSDVQISSLDQFVDPLGPLYYRMEKEVMGSSETEAVAKGAENSRDKCRSPFQWSSGPNAGFCPEGVNSWLPVNENCLRGVNLADEYADRESFWWFMHNLIDLRNRMSALNRGEYRLHPLTSEKVLVYERSFDKEKCLVVLNMSDTAEKINFVSAGVSTYYLLLATDPVGVKLEEGSITLHAYTGLIIEV